MSDLSDAAFWTAIGAAAAAVQKAASERSDMEA